MSVTNTISDLITRKELCEKLRIHPNTSVRLEKQGLIKSIHVGGSIRYCWNEVLEGLKEKEKER
jgi:hypothetical protein